MKIKRLLLILLLVVLLGLYFFYFPKLDLGIELIIRADFRTSAP